VSEGLAQGTYSDALSMQGGCSHVSSSSALPEAIDPLLTCMNLQSVQKMTCDDEIFRTGACV